VSQIDVYMPTITVSTNDGGSGISSYNLEYNGGGVGTTFSELIGYSAVNMV
jgi:hypothetical protein